MIKYHGGDYKGSVKNDMEYLTRKTNHIDIAMINDHCGDAVMSIYRGFSNKDDFCRTLRRPGRRSGIDFKMLFG
ncbi:MAG: hypothetical protein GY865_16425 [candidate division Zixibacteria bacterium]|nr:hypothetical protein [candidate division Zixibacteria bacterium]